MVVQNRERGHQRRGVIPPCDARAGCCSASPEAGNAAANRGRKLKDQKRRATENEAGKLYQR